MIEPLHLTGTYLETYNAIARPQRIFSVTRYFVERWVRLLGPGRAWLVVALRQTCYWNHQQDWCVIDAKTLSRWVGCNRVKIFDWLGATYVPWFVWRDGHSGYRQVDGRPMRNPNRYKVLLDEPLTPADATHLSEWLINHAPSGADGALAAVQTSLSTPRTELLRMEGATIVAPSMSEVLTVQEIVQQALPQGMPTEKEDRVLLADLCSQLHAHITQPQDQLITSQYFRLNWAPTMPAGLAWIIFWLRDRCWYDPKTGHYRDTTWLPDVETVANLVGASVRSVQRWLKAAPPDWVQVVNQQRGRDRERPQRMAIQFHVAVRDLLTPEDAAQYPIVLSQRNDDKRQRTRRREDRQKATHGEERSTTEGNSQTPGTTTKGDTRRTRTSTNGDSQASRRTTENDGVGRGTMTESDGIKLVIVKSLNKEIGKQQQFLPDSSVAVAFSLAEWLDYYDIYDPARTHILARQPSLHILVGWLLYVESQSWPDNPAGVVVKGILENQTLPLPFAALAGLTFRQWATFANRPGAVTEADQPLLDAWRRVYASAPVPWGLADQWSEPISEVVRTGETNTQDRHQSDRSSPDAQLWDAVLEQLGQQMTAATFDAWLRDTSVVRREDDLWVIRCISSTAQAWLSTRLRPSVEKVLAGVVGRPCRIQFCVRDQ